MAIPVAKKRLLSFDLIRGYLLLIIIIDHLGRWPSPFELLTGRGGLWISAAEGFFFISGLLVGLTAIRKIARRGFLPIWRKLWKRSLVLYLLSVAATLGFTWLAFQLPSAPKEGIISTDHWPTIIGQTLQLHYVYGWHDFLPRYAIYMFFAPLAGYLLYRGMWWAVIWASILIWAWKGNSSFNSAWQIIFFAGMAVGYHYYQIKHWFHHRLTLSTQRIIKQSSLIITLVGLTVSYILNILPRALVDYYWMVDPLLYRWATPEDKSQAIATLNAWAQALGAWFSHATMGIGRIGLFLIAFAALYFIAQRFGPTINRWLGWLLMPFGQNSLLTYMTHAVVLFYFPVILPWNGNIASNTIDFIIAIMSTWLIVVIIAYRQAILQQLAHCFQRKSTDKASQDGLSRRPAAKPRYSAISLLGILGATVLLIALIKTRQTH